MDPLALASIGMPVLPGPHPLRRGEEALVLAQGLLQQPGIEPEMGAAWLSALATDFPSVHARGAWPTFVVLDHDRFLKLRRIAREHLAQMF